LVPPAGIGPATPGLGIAVTFLLFQAVTMQTLFLKYQFSG